MEPQDLDTSNVVLQPRQLPGCTLHLRVHSVQDTLVPLLTSQCPSPFISRPASVVHSPQVDELLNLSLKLTTGFARRCAY